MTPESRSVFLGGLPDWLGGSHTDGYDCFEYENSSRGFVAHVCKYIHLASSSPSVNFRVTIIGSLHHSRLHQSDFRNALAAATACNLRNLKFSFGHDDGTGQLVHNYALSRR
jgi:hypothetical protein